MNEDQTLKSLQLEFDEILTCIKPIYLSWKSQQDKVFIAGWIKKLTSLKNFTLDSMHLRNLYILALYENLRRDILCDPFTKIPPTDELPPLSNHLKQLIEKFSVKHTTLDWLENDEKTDINCIENTTDYEEDDYIGDLKIVNDMHEMKQNILNNSERMIANKSNELETNALIFGDVFKYHNFDNDWIRHSSNQIHEKEVKLMDDSEGFKQTTVDTRLKYKPNEYNLFNKVQEKEMERRLAQLQNAYHEDIMKLRNQNEIEIQNIINRKNAEIEQTRNNFKEKIQEQETQVQLLESKANDCMKQLQMFQDIKLKEIDQIKRSHVETIESFNRDNETRIANLVEDFQKEKLKLVEENRKREEMFTKETKEYFEKVKSEFTDKSSNTNRQINDLEADISELKSTKNKIVELNEKLKLERDNLYSEVRKLQNDLSESQKRYQFIDNQHNRFMMSHEKEISSLKETLEAALHKSEISKDEIETKAQDKIEELENQTKDLQLKLLDAHRTYKKELENINLNHSTEKFRSKQAYEDEIENIKLQLKNNKFQSESKIQDLERKLELKESQFNQSIKELEMKEKLSLQLVEDVKQEMTHNNDRLLRKKQFEFEQTESELKQEIQEKNKEIIDLMHQLSNHKQDSEVKLADIRKWSDNQISSLKNDWKEEKKSLEKDFQHRLEKEIDKNKKAIDKVNEEKNKKIAEMQTLLEAKTQEIPALKRDIYQQAQIQKSEMNDLIQLYETEKTKLIEDHKVLLENLNRQTNELKSNLEEKHAENISQILTKTNIKLKEIEDEYAERSMQSFKLINELKLTAEKIKEEKLELLNSQEAFKINLTKKYNSEIDNLQKVIKSNLETYKREMNNEQIKYKNIEKQSERKDYEMKNQINFIKLEYETKLSKLMPAEVQSDYEETIQSLRTQISFLQQKIGILEDEVTSTNMFKAYHSNGYSKHKCDQIYES